MPALVLLDVDGVLNALGRPSSGDGWASWRTGTAVADGRSWPIRWAPPLVDAVLAWSQVAELSWLTTWGHDANGSLRALLGLPELPVAGTHEQQATAGGPSPAAHAAVTPAAPDPLTGRWWKFDVVRRLVLADPGRRVVWLDDDLARQDDLRGWVRARCDCLLIAPEPALGLQPVHVRAVQDFLAA